MFRTCGYVQTHCCSESNIALLGFAGISSVNSACDAVKAASTVTAVSEQRSERIEALSCVESSLGVYQKDDTCEAQNMCLYYMFLERLRHLVHR